MGRRGTDLITSAALTSAEAARNSICLRPIEHPRGAVPTHPQRHSLRSSAPFEISLKGFYFMSGSVFLSAGSRPFPVLSADHRQYVFTFLFHRSANAIYRDLMSFSCNFRTKRNSPHVSIFLGPVRRSEAGFKWGKMSKRDCSPNSIEADSFKGHPSIVRTYGIARPRGIRRIRVVFSLVYCRWLGRCMTRPGRKRVLWIIHRGYTQQLIPKARPPKSAFDVVFAGKLRML